MEAPASPLLEPELVFRKQKRLLLIAWAATLLPLVAFGYLTWQSVELNKQVQAAQQELKTFDKRKDALVREVTKLETQVNQLTEKLGVQQAVTKDYRDKAGIRIQFYRPEDRAIVEKALVRLGWKVEPTRGSAQTISQKANTIAYGSQVSPQDIRDVAIALVEEGFPLRRITAAQTRPEPKLVQVYASTLSERECGVLTVGQIRAGRTCGELSK